MKSIPIDCDSPRCSIDFVDIIDVINMFRRLGLPILVMRWKQNSTAIT